jgi:hypothetical protein
MLITVVFVYRSCYPHGAFGSLVSRVVMVMCYCWNQIKRPPFPFYITWVLWLVLETYSILGTWVRDHLLCEV